VTLKRFVRVVVLAALAAVFLVPASSASAATRCPATFHVLHNDRIGAMSLPAGLYTVTVNNLSCATASSLFAQFLQDYDGVLPYPWRANAANRSFSNGRSSFSVRLARSEPPAPPSPPTPSNAVACPSYFTVLHNDRIGSVSLPAGRYRTSLLSSGLTCSRVSSLFAHFLEYPSGRLPGGWAISSASSSQPAAIFSNLADGLRFRVDYLGKSSGRGGGGGGTSNGSACTTYRVLHNDHIGSLYVPRGTYNVIIPLGSTLSCAEAVRALTQFLNLEALPRPWLIDGSTGTFTRGYDSRQGFRIEPTSGRIG
jgi:hypothetical protein